MIWDLFAPPKVKVFLWAACTCKGVLPTQSNLRSRGVKCSSLCVLCDRAIENTCHSLVSCPTSSSIWRQIVQVEEFTDLFFKICESVEAEKRCSFGMVLWRLWNMRNTKLWENRDTPATQVVKSVEEILYNWRWAKKAHNSSQQGFMVGDQNDVVIRWCAPNFGSLKCNVDVGLFENDDITGCGMCMRDHRGEVLHALSCWSKPMVSPHFGKALGLFHAINWV